MRESWDLETTVLLISLAIIPVLIAFILLCLRIKTSKSNPDLFGTVGTVTATKEEEAYLPGGLNVSGENHMRNTKLYDYSFHSRITQSIDYMQRGIYSYGKYHSDQKFLDFLLMMRLCKLFFA